QADDAACQTDEDQHCPRHTLVHVLQQDLQGQSGKDKEGPVQQVGDDSQADHAGVPENVASRACRVAVSVQRRINKAFGKAAEDADEQERSAAIRASRLAEFTLISDEDRTAAEMD